MKHRWCQTVNKTVYYYQTPFNVALILEKVSNYNDVLIEQVNMVKAALFARVFFNTIQRKLE